MCWWNLLFVAIVVNHHVVLTQGSSNDTTTEEPSTTTEEPSTTTEEPTTTESTTIATTVAPSPDNRLCPQNTGMVDATRVKAKTAHNFRRGNKLNEKIYNKGTACSACPQDTYCNEDKLCQLLSKF
ncbi:hypothetical protein COOONC_01501 [Cooperia oncophora]